MIIEFIIKGSLFPILVEFCYNSASKIWASNKLASIILYLTGFLLTEVGNLLLIGIIILIVYFSKKK